MAVVFLPRPAHAAKENFDRSKPHLNISSLGDSQAGGVPLHWAIAAYADEVGWPLRRALGQAGKGPDAGPLSVQLRPYLVQYETSARHYDHLDALGVRALVPGLITGDLPGYGVVGVYAEVAHSESPAAPVADGAILVVSAIDGPMPQTREHILLARQVGVPALLVFIDRADEIADPRQLDLVEAQTRELLTRCGFDGDKTPIIRGSALRAVEGDRRGLESIGQLLTAMDRYLSLPPRAEDKPFLMPIENVLRPRGRGTVATGRIETGIVQIGDWVDLVGLAPSQQAGVTGLAGANTARLGVAGPGDNVAVRLESASGEPVGVWPGQVMAAPGSLQSHATFQALVYVYRKEEGGRHTPFHNKYRPQFVFRSSEVAGEVSLPDGLDLPPGSYGPAVVNLIVPVAMDKGLRFAIREGGRTVGAGQVVEILK